MSDELADDTGLAELGEMVGTLSEWIDKPNRERFARMTRDEIEAELLQLHRTIKIGEEGGEVVSALIGATGANPRKGVTHTPDAVDGELLDVAVTALGAWESRNGNHGYVIAALYQKMHGLLGRVGLPVPERESVGGDDA